MSETIVNRAVVTDYVAEWMHQHCPSYTIDTLLTHPVEALTMGLDVAEQAGKLTRKEARAARAALNQLSDIAHVVASVNEICRTALSSRKRGDLKRDRA